MFDLTGKFALITGATGGIGSAIAKTLYNQGATVVLSGRNQEALENLKNSISENGKGILLVPCDLSCLPDIDCFAKNVLNLTDGKLDILVNNAGLTKDTLMLRMTDEMWNSVIDVNLTANFKLTRAFLPSMMKARFGRIISVASVVGVAGNAGQVNYAASKGGLIAMSKSLAMEVASRGITVNTVAPGFIQTAMTDVLPDSVKEDIKKQIPSHILGTPQDIANSVVFLASDEASYITGQTLHVNGGMLRV